MQITLDIAPDLLKRTLKNGGEYADIYIEKAQSTSIVLEDDKIEKVTTGIDGGIGIRLICNGKTGYAYSNDYSKDSLNNLTSIVSNIANQKELVREFDLKKKVSSVDCKILLPPGEVDIEKKVSLLIEANKAARGMDKKIRQVKIVYSDLIQNVTIINSDNEVTEDNRIYSLAMVQVVATDGKILQTGYEPIGGLIGFELFDDNPLYVIAEKAAKRALFMLQARPAQAGRMAVVLSSEAGGTLIHEAVGHGLEADLAQDGLSVYSKKTGEQVASKLVTVIDDSTIPNRRGSFRFDDEGVEAQKTVLIENGILKRFLYDRLTSLKAGVKSSGNGRRESYQHRPIPRMTNTIIAPGNHKPEDVIKSLQDGLLVKKMGGGQVNTVNGDFVFEVSEGFMVKNGEIVEAVRGATLTGNGPEVLNNITMVGNDLGFSIGTCGKDGQGVPVSDAQPTIRIESLVVGGEVS